VNYGRSIADQELAVVRSGKNCIKSRAKPWEYQIGEPPNTVTAYERLDRGRTVSIRWWVPETKRFQRKSLGIRVRQEQGGVDPELQRKAVSLTQRWYDDLMAGRTPSAAVLLAGGRDESVEERVGPLTIEQGLAMATTIPTGLYVVETDHLKEVRRAARDLVCAIGMDHLGRPRTWDGLRYSNVRDIWLRLAWRYVKTGRGGHVWTERCVVIFLQVNSWLVTEEMIDRTIPFRKTWREQMRREWEQLTEKRIVQNDLRHSEEEIARLFAALHHENVDPRIALMVEIGAEARLGQVRRLRRADVDLGCVGGFGLGRLVVHGSGKKLGVTRDLTPEERAAVDAALNGYLRDLEREFQAGIRTDYFMFPAGRLRYDVPPSRVPRKGLVTLEPPVRRARTDLPDKPINKRSMTDMFHQLEWVANVQPVEGRAWYGIRRRATDVYEDYESDERVLNDQTGHGSSDTRRSAYQQRERDVIRARSAETRRRVRAQAFGRPTIDTPMEGAAGVGRGRMNARAIDALGEAGNTS
jgi:hypothetical protein